MARYRLTVAIEFEADPLDLRQQALLLAEHMTDEGTPPEDVVMLGDDAKVAAYLAGSWMLTMFQRALPGTTVETYRPNVDVLD